MAGAPTEPVPAVPGLPADEPPTEPTGRRRRRWFVVGAVVVVLAAGAGIGIWLGTSGSSGPGLKVTTQVVAVGTGTMKQTVSTTGTVNPAQQADLDFAASGKITAVDVTAGQTVTVGQTLATIDPAALQAQADSAQASLTAAQAKLSSDEADGASTSQIQSDQASVTSAQSQLTSANTDLADATLTSTIAGTVASVSLTVGQQVSSGGSGSGGTGSTGTGSAGTGSTGTGSTGTGSTGSSSSAQVVVIGTSSFVVNGTVDDTEVGDVKAGDQAVITPTGATTPVYGTVSSVGIIASQSSGVATFPVVIKVTGTPANLYAGSTADVSIIVKELYDVVEVPTAAISYSGGNAQVTAVVNGAHVTKDITVGESSGGETQVTSGLKAGDKVVERVVTFTGGAAGGRAGLFGRTGTGGFPSGAPGGFGGGAEVPGGSRSFTGGGGGSGFTGGGGFTGG
ncbi:MAG TPA: biotin/lipoyl-binding protein [Acidimicrobiales bacterium]